MFENRSLEELERIALAGGGFVVVMEDWTTEELTRLANAARAGQARLYMSGASRWPSAELEHIAAAGQGCVVYEDL